MIGLSLGFVKTEPIVQSTPELDPELTLEDDTTPLEAEDGTQLTTENV